MTSLMPFYDLRDWWLSNDDIAEVLKYSENPYMFFPANQDPQSAIPYVRYTVRNFGNDNQFWMKRQDVVIVPFLKSVSDSNKILNAMEEMAQEDDSAKLLNKWIVENNRTREFDFQSISFVMAGDIEPVEELGGVMVRPATFSMRYVKVE